MGKPIIQSNFSLIAQFLQYVNEGTHNGSHLKKQLNIFGKYTYQLSLFEMCDRNQCHVYLFNTELELGCP